MFFFLRNMVAYASNKILLTIVFVFLFTCFSFQQLCFAGETDSSANALNEFKEYKEDTAVATANFIGTTNECAQNCKKEESGIYWIAGILAFTVIAGIFVRFKATRQLRSLFLIASIVVLGFYRGACPCPIRSLQNIAFVFMGQNIKWQSIIYFAALLPITYFFGRVFCGWICHLGALQEFIFSSSNFKLLQGREAQRSMRIIRKVVLIILLAQLIITKTNLYKEVDPFAVIYNFSSDYLVGWVLVAILILSSIFIYRPFCKTICPVGLILGWMSKIPGASVLGTNENCISCKTCNNKCKIRAITHDGNSGVLENEECIRCGDCISSCSKKNAMSFFFNNQQHSSIIKLKE